MTILKATSIVLFCVIFSCQTKASQIQVKDELTDSPQWIDIREGQKLFGLEDIVRFDWDKQIFELTRPKAMDLMDTLTDLDKPFIVQIGSFTIYEGSLVQCISSKTYPHPAIYVPQSSNGLKPPLFAIEAASQKGIDKDLRFSEYLKETLQQANVLWDIDINTHQHR